MLRDQRVSGLLISAAIHNKKSKQTQHHANVNVNGKRSTLDVRNRNIQSRIKDFERDTNMRIKVDKKVNALWPENIKKEFINTGKSPIIA
jgi:hypothetical protein